MDLSVAYIFGEARDLTKKYGLKLLALLLLNMIVTVALNLVRMPAGFFDAYKRALEGNTHAVEQLSKMNTPNVPVTIAQAIISIFLGIVIYRAAIAYTRDHNISLLDAFKVPVMTFLKFIGLSIVVVACVVAGFVLLIVPGVYLAVRLIWSFYYILEHKEASIMDAVRWSWSATDGVFFELLGLFLVAAICILAIFFGLAVFSIIGALAGPVLILVLSLIVVILYLCATVLIYFAQTKVYCELHERVE